MHKSGRVIYIVCYTNCVYLAAAQLAVTLQCLAKALKINDLYLLKLWLDLE